MRTATRQEKFVQMLIDGVSVEQRCEYLQIDKVGPFCSKDYDGSVISERRRNVCDTASLQLWCLDKERCDKCIFYQGDKVD